MHLPAPWCVRQVAIVRDSHSHSRLPAPRRSRRVALVPESHSHSPSHSVASAVANVRDAHLRPTRAAHSVLKQPGKVLGRVGQAASAGEGSRAAVGP
eukprot:10856565-Alexandrium_andersonii.AAC.1